MKLNINLLPFRPYAVLVAAYSFPLNKIENLTSWTSKVTSQGVGDGEMGWWEKDRFKNGGRP